MAQTNVTVSPPTQRVNVTVTEEGQVAVNVQTIGVQGPPGPMGNPGLATQWVTTDW